VQPVDACRQDQGEPGRARGGRVFRSVEEPVLPADGEVADLEFDKVVVVR